MDDVVNPDPAFLSLVQEMIDASVGGPSGSSPWLVLTCDWDVTVDDPADLLAGKDFSDEVPSGAAFWSYAASYSVGLDEADQPELLDPDGNVMDSTSLGAWFVGFSSGPNVADDEAGDGWLDTFESYHLSPSTKLHYRPEAWTPRFQLSDGSDGEPISTVGAGRLTLVFLLGVGVGSLP